MTPGREQLTRLFRSPSLGCTAKLNLRGFVVQEGRLWCITDEWEVGTIADGIFKCLGHLGNEFVVDIAFHPVDGVLWAVNRLVS